MNQSTRITSTPNLIAQHDSWISVDPIVGCPAACSYCYLAASEFRPQTPSQRVAPEVALDALVAWDERMDSTSNAVCIGNYTDTLMTRANRDYLYKFMRSFADMYPDRTLCLVTKTRIDSGIARDLSSASNGRTVVVFSQSFARELTNNIERGPTSDFAATLKGIEAVSAAPGLRAIHFWRPFLKSFNPLDTLRPRIGRLREAGCVASVVIGYVRHPASDVDVTVSHISEPATQGRPGESIDLRLLDAAMTVASEDGYPLYRCTSCALALATSSPERLGTSQSPHRASDCEAVVCPEPQRARCAAEWPPMADPQRIERALILLHRNDFVDFSIGSDLNITVGEIDEFLYNSIVHIVGPHIKAKQIRARKVWLGAVAVRGGSDE